MNEICVRLEARKRAVIYIYTLNDCMDCVVRGMRGSWRVLDTGGGSLYYKMAFSSAVKIDLEFLWENEGIMLRMEYAKPTLLFDLNPLVKQRIRLVNRSIISRFSL